MLPILTQTQLFLSHFFADNIFHKLYEDEIFGNTSIFYSIFFTNLQKLQR